MPKARTCGQRGPACSSGVEYVLYIAIRGGRKSTGKVDKESARSVGEFQGYELQVLRSNKSLIGGRMCNALSSLHCAALRPAPPNWEVQHSTVPRVPCPTCSRGSSVCPFRPRPVASHVASPAIYFTMDIQ
jgi:hypothetical protein